MDTYFNIYVTHVVDTVDCADRPNYCNMMFWGQKQRDVSAKLEEHLKACNFHCCPSPTFLELKRENLIVCVEVNSSWLRATIEDYSKESNMVEVFCIDYGLTQNVQLGFIRLVPQDAVFVKECPPLAFKFVLGDVGVKKDRSGIKSVLEFFKGNMENKQVKAVSLGFHGGYEGVRVYLKDELLAKLLVESGMGYAGGSYAEALLKPVPIHSYFSVASLTSPVKSLHPSPIKPQQSTGNNCTYIASSLELNATHSIIVTQVINGPAKFSIQRKSAEADRHLDAISQRLSAFSNKTLVNLANPNRGAPCIAASSRDTMFHRGLVVQDNDAKFTEVYFVDYGYSELIDRELLFKIPDDIVKMDLHAIRVSLAEFDTLIGFKNSSETFEKMVLNKIFKCRVVGCASSPQSVVLYNEEGRSIKDLMLSALSVAGANISALNIPLANHSVSPILGPSRAAIKVNPAEVDPEEKLFITFVGAPGFFFGQFEKRPEADLKAVENELSSVYGNSTAEIPLLYADIQSHLGDYAVVKWSADGHLYRVKIMEELGNDVTVNFIDYGNSIKVARRELWAPVKLLKQFCQPPFGIQCFVADVNMSSDQWTKTMENQSFRVKLKPEINGIHPAIIDSSIFDNKLNIVRKVSSCLSPEAPAWVPADSAANGMTSSNPKAVRQLFDGPENTFRSAVPKVTNQTRPNSSCSITSTDSKLARPVESSRVEVSPKRSMPIAEPIQLFYPPQERLDGTTKTLEIVFIECPNSFYCQLTEAVPPLDALMQSLATVYSDEAKPCVVGAKNGIACIAQYTVDGGWYRGQVINVEGSEVDILFVDYGNKQRTPVNLVKAIEEQFVVLPHQAYHCSLSGVPSTRSWTTEEKANFEKTAMSITLTATFAAQCENEKYPVRLVKDCSGTPLVINELFGSLTSRSAIPEYTNLPTSSTPLKVNVAWFCNTERFFLSPVDLGPYQEKLGELEKFYSTLLDNEMMEDAPSVGLPCVVRFIEDGLYYRSKIISICGQMANVLFVDYGNEQETPLKELKRIHPRFMDCPQLTWQCKLNDVKLATNPPADGKQHIDACFPNGEILEAVFHPASGSVFSVELKVPNIGDVAEYLMKHKVVSSTIQQEKEIVLAPQNLELPPGKTLSVNAVIPYVKSPTEFWIQFDSEEVDQLMERIDQLAIQPEFINKKSLVPSVGKPCLAFYADDGRWYRATVQLIDGDCCTVYYIDYGNSCSVKITDLKELPEDLARIPAMAFKCCLDEADNVTKDITEAFQIEVLDLVATVKFVKTLDGILHIRLYNSGGVNLSEKIGLSKPSKQLEVYVVYAETPSCFWIQRKQDEDLINKIQEQLCELDGSNAELYKLHEKPVVGQIYAVIHPGYNTWYRAELKSIANTSAVIQFVDYGDSHPVPISNICSLPGDLKTIPPMAIHCSLSINNEMKWSEEAVKYFHSVCSPDVVCRVKLGSKEQNSLQLVDAMLTPTEDVVGTLMTKIHSSHSKNVEDVVELLESVCISTKSAIPSSREWIRDPTPGQVISTKGSAVCLTSALAVWIQLDPSLADGVVDSIQRHVNSPDFAKSIAIQPSVGCFCLALFSDDQQWYRAQVEAIHPDSIEVKYVDYGNNSSVGLDNLRALPESLMEQPALALRCALDGATDSGSSLPTVQECQAAIFSRILSVTLVGKTDDYIIVRLLDENGQDLNQKLGLDRSSRNVEVIPNSEQVRVSYIKSASMFWIQRKSDDEVIEQIRDNLRTLDGQSSDAGRIDPIVGELYAVMHPEYNRFYRARVVRIHGEEIEAFFLDYGHTLWVCTASVRPCPALLKYIPPMATECTFRTPIHPDQFTEEMQKAFTEATEGVMCQAVFSGPQPAKGIHSIEAIYAKGIEVASLLSKLLSNSNPVDNNSLPFFPSQQRQRGL